MKICAVILVFMTNFAMAAKPEVSPAVKPAPAPGGPGFCIFGAQSGKRLDSEAAYKTVVWKNDVVYVGETHDEPLDHQAQLETLRSMRIARGSRIAVGFEMLDQAVQPALDDYLAGKLPEPEFLARADWKKEGGFDFALYRPLFDFIAANKLKALALNVPRAVVKKIARSGLAGLAPEERKQLPERLDITAHKKYNEYLKKSFEEHGGTSEVKIFNLENYAASMAAWNEAMGARLADFLAANPGYAALVVAGNGHIIYNAAIPASVKARMKGVRQASFYTENAAHCPETFPKAHKDMANYIWYINHPPKPAPAAPAAVSTAAVSAAAVSTAAPAATPPSAEKK